MNNKGMTLIEIVVVLAILAILATTLVPSVGTQIKRAKIEATRAEMLRIKDALLAFYDDTRETASNQNRFPQNLTQLQTDPVAAFIGWAGPYIISGFDVQDYTMDEWRNNYRYPDPLTATSCTLTSNGSDGVFGTADDIPPAGLTVDATMLNREKIQRVRDELEVIKKAAQQNFEDSDTSFPYIRDYAAAITDLSTDYISPDYLTDEWEINYIRQSGAGVQRRYFYSAGPDGVDDSGGRNLSAGPFPGSDDIFPY